MQIYRTLANVKPLPGNSDLGGARSAYVNVYFPDKYLTNWEQEITEFLEYYGYQLKAFDMDPAIAEADGLEDERELNAIKSSAESGFPRYGVFHTFPDD